MKPSGANPVLASASDIAGCAGRLAREASLEINSLEVEELEAARDLLRPGQRIYVSHLPRQSWEESLRICARLAAAGFDPIPHIPVRLLADREQFAGLLRAAAEVGVREPLLLAGDYQSPRGDFPDVLTALRTDQLQSLGYSRVSFAGHPEGHPQVASRDKWRLSANLGMQVTFVTQFFFAAAPFTQWACDLRAAGVRARLIAGVAGPAGIARLLRLARRCGVGPSIRALTSRPSAMFGLMSDHDPAVLVRELAREWQRCTGLFDGLHVFSLGGFLRTATWLRRQAS